MTIPGRKRPARDLTNDAAGGNGGGSNDGQGPNVQDKEKPAADKPAAPETRTFPAGTYVLRMDQPYSRIADTLLDYQYWAPDDPQRNPYDDTGWTFGELFNVKVVRVSDAKVLEAPMELVKGELTAAGAVTGGTTASLYAINHNADPSLADLRYRFKDATIDVAEEPFEAGGEKFNRGLVHRPKRDQQRRSRARPRQSSA